MIDVCEVLREAAKLEASDVYFKAGICPRARRNGSIENMNFPVLLAGDMLDCLLKIMDERERDVIEEKGEYCFSYEAPMAGRYRVKVYKSRDIVSMVFHRILPIDKIVQNPAAFAQLEAVADRKKGLVLFAGDAGSGKTTAMAAVLHEINENYPVHIMTLENPIEVLHESQRAIVSQRACGADFESTALAMDGALKEAVDVLMYDGKTDAQVISKLCQNAEAGMLVIAGVYGNNLAEILRSITVDFPMEEQGSIRKRLSGVLETIVICKKPMSPAKPEDGQESVHSFEVLVVDDNMKNRICNSR